MNITIENIILALATIFFSLLTFLLSKTFKDLTSKLENNSIIIADLKIQLAVVAERLSNASFSFLELNKRLEKLESDFRECKNKGCTK
jgi:hypothetical protein